MLRQSTHFYVTFFGIMHSHYCATCAFFINQRLDVFKISSGNKRSKLTDENMYWLLKVYSFINEYKQSGSLLEPAFNEFIRRGYDVHSRWIWAENIVRMVGGQIDDETVRNNQEYNNFFLRNLQF